MLSAIKSTRRLTTVAIALLILFSIHTRADHAWGSYTWDDTDGTLDLVLVDNLTQSYWSSALAVATSDWNSWNWDNDGSSENVLNSVLDLSITNGINVACDPVSGMGIMVGLGLRRYGPRGGGISILSLAWPR
jgi:hypothetical protein